jgi:hypothetical protein
VIAVVEGGWVLEEGDVISAMVGLSSISKQAYTVEDGSGAKTYDCFRACWCFTL